MKTLEIQKEAAIKAYENAKNSGRKLLEDLLGKKTFLKDVKARIKTPEDAIAELGESDPEVISLRTLEYAGIENHIYYNQLAVVIVKALNEGWVPNWNDSNEYKYFPWFFLNDKNGSSGFRFDGNDLWPANSHVGSHLCLKSSELANYAGEQFTQVYEKFMSNHK